MKEIVARAVVGLDELGHRTRLHSRALCLSADVVYGWGPEAADWPDSANRFHRWLHRYLG